MFNALNGTLIERSFDVIRIDTHGIEWDVTVPATMVDAFGPAGGKTRVLVHLQHREDAMKLYGFPNEEGRALFLELVKVEGIGPRQAVRILSGIRADALDDAIGRDDLAALEKVPGVGKKTAQKILLALKGRIVRATDEAQPDAAADVTRALIDMGFDRKDAERAVKAAMTSMPVSHPGDANDERELFRVALLSLTGGA